MDSRHRLGIHVAADLTFLLTRVARALIDIPANTEKGLSQRFLWLFPAPLYEHIEKLGEAWGRG